MKKCLLLLWTLLLLLPAFTVQAAYDGEGNGPYDELPEKRSGWFLGSDQGVLFFVGDSGDLFNVQYWGSLFGGYNVGGWVQPFVSLGQGIGTLKGFGNPTTFWFVFEGGSRFTPLHTVVRPFFSGTVGLYVLDFSNFGAPVNSGANLTYSGGGGLEFSFGRSNLELKGNYRGFRNAGGDLQGVTVTLGYFFKF